LSTQKVKVALAQMDCAIKDKNRNIIHSMEILEKVKGKVDIICFPEFFTTGYNLKVIGADFYDIAETIPGETTEQLSKKTKQYGMAILGSIIEKDPLSPDILYDSAFIINKNGELVSKYRKYYLYPLEHQYFKPGKEIPVVDLGIARVGLAICYDHAFPELFRALSLKGAQIIFILSAIPKGYEYLLNLRARARAQDNQLFIAHVNRVGKDGDIQFCGLSKMVNPRGEVIAEASATQEQVLIKVFELDMIMKERKQERVARSLRSEIYEYISRLL